MLQVLVWYLVVQGVAVAGLPLAFAWLRHIPSRGYAVSKVLGILLSGVLLWWGSITHLWGNTNAAILTAMGMVFVVGLVAMRGHWHEVHPWWQQHSRFVLVTEVVFLLMYLFWVAVRAMQPQLETAGGEKWMEIAFLNAVIRSPNFPPHDPWLSGYAISYYYLGYLLVGMITQLTAIPTAIAFNLGGASWYALAAIGAYAIVYDLLGGRRINSPLFGPLLLLVSGNGEGFMEVLHARGLLPPAFWRWLDIRNINTAPSPPFSWKPQRFFWWWQASRTLHDYTPWGADQEVIDEFPAFSFILGDMHPHVLALPFVLLAIALALNLYRHVGLVPNDRREHGRYRDLLARFTPLAGYALVLGALGFLNTWDFPIYWALMVGAMIVAQVGSDFQSVEPGISLNAQKPSVADRIFNREGNSKFLRTLFDAVGGLLPEAIALGLLSIALYFPFWWALRSQAGGVLPNLFNASRWPQFAVMFAPLLVPVIGVLVSSARRDSGIWLRALLWAGVLLLVIIVAALILGFPAVYPYVTAVINGEAIFGIDAEIIGSALIRRLTNPWVALILAWGASSALLLLFQKRDVPRGIPFPLLMVLLGILLTLAPEFIFLRDIFNTRMNTIFKFYFQAWVLWSLAGAWQLARWLEMLVEHKRRTYALVNVIVSILLIAVGLVYTILAIPARAEEHGTPWTLDGAAWLQASGPPRSQDYAAIQWLNANIVGRPVILEAPGDQNRAYAYEGRVSALTGLPTVLGWADHERQWRGTADEQTYRAQDLETLFTTPNIALAREILEKYNVEYIYIGPLELSRYPAEGLAKFSEVFPAVYAQDGVLIYRVTP